MPDPFARPVFVRMRRRCLALPEVTEKAAWSHPCFRVSNRMFCAFEMIRTRPTIALRLPPDTCEDLRARELAFVTPYGRGHWASVWVDGTIDWTLLETLLQASYREVASPRLVRLLDGPRKRGSGVI
jgi:predicted DNA-binding protein (MmcQ/YjbR family)